MIIDLICIMIICCFYVQSGAADTLKRIVWRILKGTRPYEEYSLKPFDCELCLTWWCGFLYVLITGCTLAGIVTVAACAWFTPIVVDVMHLLCDVPRHIIDKLSRK